jgi:type IV pilus assembly protein PilB
VRFRVDGVLKDIIELPAELTDVIVARIKVLAELRTDEHFKPQDGRFKVELSDGNEVTTRVSILPVYDGEKVVMRILKAKKQKTDLTDLGYTDVNQGKIYGNAEKAHGMLLVTGPTGSGKTTTIYTVLKLLNKPEVNITTVEDPIKYKLDRVNQIQVNQAAGLTFASGLRSILRQDPDVVMIGEIRDEETASIAVNAALTGHLVLATLHTNSAIDTLPRLLEMQVEPYLVASTVNVVIAQRLVRKLCDKCKKPVQVTPELLNAIAVDDSEFSKDMLAMAQQFVKVGDTIYGPGGCAECNEKGFAGRLAIAEVLDITDEIKEAIYAKKSPLEIEQVARDQGYTSFIEDALLKVKEGSTSLDEVIRVTKE